jgi:hypothetical protein
MRLKDWQKKSWLTGHQSSREEISSLLALVERDLEACRTPGLATDWRFSIAYNAALQAATAALAAAGYRAAREAHHHRVIQSLRLTIGADSRFIGRFDAFRKKRNLSSYEFGGAISDQEAEEMATLAQDLRTRVSEWIKAHHPHLM